MIPKMLRSTRLVKDALHAFALALGLSVAAFGQRSPQILSLASALSFGTWFALVLRDRQSFDETFMGDHHYPKGISAWIATCDVCVRRVEVS